MNIFSEAIYKDYSGNYYPFHDSPDKSSFKLSVSYSIK